MILDAWPLSQNGGRQWPHFAMPRAAGLRAADNAHEVALLAASRRLSYAMDRVRSKFLNHITVVATLNN